MTVLRKLARTTLYLALLGAWASSIPSWAQPSGGNAADNPGLHLGWVNKPNHVDILTPPIGQTVDLGKGVALNYSFTENIGTYVRYERLQPEVLDPTQDTKLWLLGFDGMLFQTAKTGGRWVIEGSKSTQNGVDNKQVMLDFLVAF